MSIQKNVTILEQQKIQTSVLLSSEQLDLLQKLNIFAVYQVTHDSEVRSMPVKAFYKVNQELELALVALMTTCSMLDPKREGNETEKFFEKEIKIIQKDSTQKYIDFGRIRPFLLQNFLIPEIVDDWILYRDVASDGIYALIDRKTELQGLPSYSRGGSPVYEFARFYRKFMEDKILHKRKSQNDFKESLIKTLSEQIVHQQLEQGYSAQEILNHIMNGELLEMTSSKDKLALPQK